MGVLAGDGRKVRLRSGWPGLGAFSLEGGFSVPEKGRCFTGGSREQGDAEGDSLGGREQKAAPRRNGRPAGEGNRCSRRMRGVGMEDTVKGVGLRELNLGFAGPVVAPCEGSQGAWLALRQWGPGGPAEARPPRRVLGGGGNGSTVPRGQSQWTHRISRSSSARLGRHELCSDSQGSGLLLFLKV